VFFVSVKTSTFKYYALFFSKLRLAPFRSVTFSTFRFLLGNIELGEQNVTL